MKGKLLADRGYWVMPWVSASLAVGFNAAHDFQNTPLISEAAMMTNFASSTQTSFTYTLGAGVQKVLNPHWQIGAGYEFSDWGQSEIEWCIRPNVEFRLEFKSSVYQWGVV